MPHNELNLPSPELGPKVKEAYSRLTQDPQLLKTVRSDRALQALYIQVLNQLQHVSFKFYIRDATYTHEYVLKEPYPKRPTEIALQKVQEFFDIVSGDPSILPEKGFENKEREQELLKQQRELVNLFKNDSIATYEQMRERLIRGGVEAPFLEFSSIVEYLLLKLNGEDVLKFCRENRYLNNFRKHVLRDLKRLSKPPRDRSFPYLSTIEGIQRTMEFFDVMQRATDPDRSPKLYHSARYEYYGHYLKAQIPDHIMMPTLVGLGATDILKARGIPIGFIGVNTEITWVDGFYQTSYEFWVHDENHSRRMFQFFKEMAESLGLSISEFAKQSDEFVKSKVIPLIKINTSDSEETANLKRLIKVIFFEIFHEDALAATLEVTKAGITRPPNLITPFEHIENGVVTYVMEPGATTLAYVFRKLAHDFYDKPGERFKNIVDPKYRTREKIVEAAQIIENALGFKVPTEVLMYFVSTDQGFPKDFKQTVASDIHSRPGETVPLDQEAPMSEKDLVAILAHQLHENWQERSGYQERWKLARVHLKDGRGVDDGYTIQTQTQLDEYWEEKEIPINLRKYFTIRINDETGNLALFEDIQHLPQKYLAANNQFENVKAAMSALSLVESIFEQGRHFSTVEEAMKWLKDAAHKSHLDWLLRNRHWAMRSPEHNKDWKDLSAVKQRTAIEFLKMALEIKSSLDPNWMIASQKTLFVEAFRRINLENMRKAAREVRAYVTGSRIHENWQKGSGYSDRWKPTSAKLQSGELVNTAEKMQRYFIEREIPQPFHRYYEIRLSAKTGQLVMHEDIQNLPNRYLAPNHQSENYDSGQVAVLVVDRIWDRNLKFNSIESAERWLRVASQVVHQAVLDRNANGARDNPVYNRLWRDLPPVNQKNDLSLVKIGLEARFSLAPGGVGEQQKTLIFQALSELEKKIMAGQIVKSCQKVASPN